MSPFWRGIFEFLKYFLCSPLTGYTLLTKDELLRKYLLYSVTLHTSKFEGITCKLHAEDEQRESLLQSIVT